MAVTYSLDDSIATFLSRHTDTTRAECDALARSILQSSQVSPVAFQGSFSYTVADHVRVVQFRQTDSPLDLEVLDRAHTLHGSLVAKTSFHGRLGRDRPLLVYVIEKLPGVTYLEYQLGGALRENLSEQQYRTQQTLVEDFARCV